MTNLLAPAFIGTNELIIVIVAILVLFGGTKIPQLMRGIGRGVGELHKGLDEGKRALNSGASGDDEQPYTPPNTAPKP